MPEIDIKLKAKDYLDFKKYCERRLRNGRLIFTGVAIPASLLMGQAYEAFNPGVTSLSGPITGLLMGYWAHCHYHRTTTHGKNTKNVRRLIRALEIRQTLGMNHDQALEKIIEDLDEIKNPLVKQTMITRYLINKGRIDDAMRSAENFSRLKKELDLKESWYDRYMGWIEKRIMPALILFKKRSELYPLFWAQAAYEEGNPELGDERMQKAIDLNPGIALELNVLAGNFAEIYERPETAVRRLQEAVRLMEQRPELKESFGKTGEQRNESMVIKSKLVDGALYVKRGSSLKKEFSVNELVYRALEKYAERNRLGKDFICVARSLGFLENFEGFDYHFTRRKSTANLEDAIVEEPGRTHELVATAIDRMARISAIVEDFSGEAYDHWSELERRLVGRRGERIGHNAYLHQLQMRWADILLDTALSRRNNRGLAHCDAGPKNFLPDGTVIDFEKAALADITFDAVTISEIPGSEFTSDSFNYLLERLRAYGMEVPNREELQSLAMVNAAHNAMCQFGNNASKGNKEKAGYFLERAKVWLQLLQPRLKKIFEDYVMHSKMTTEVLA